LTWLSAQVLPVDSILTHLIVALLISAVERLGKLTKAHGRLVLSGFILGGTPVFVGTRVAHAVGSPA
jgi:hypothetical protein